MAEPFAAAAVVMAATVSGGRGLQPEESPLLNPSAAGFISISRKSAFLEQACIARILSGKTTGSVVARFYFDTFDGDHSTTDSEGIDCPLMKSVQYFAVDALQDMARERLPDGPNRLFQVSVRNDSGQVVFRTTLELKSSWLLDRDEGV